METNAKRTERTFEMKITNAGAAQSFRGFFLRWAEIVTTGNGTEAERSWSRRRRRWGTGPGSWLLCFLWIKNKVRLPRFWQVGADGQADCATAPRPLYNTLAPLITPFPTHGSCLYHGTAAACVDCYFIASAWSHRHGPKQKLFASVRGWNLISSCKPRHHNIPARPFPTRIASFHTPHPPLSPPPTPSPPSPFCTSKLLRLSLARKLANNFAIKMRAQKSPEIQFVTVCC